ncbi:MAG: segregation/condensation protein A [Elusimicrobiota bacterium]
MMNSAHPATLDVHLEIFEGPLDLLLYLIRRNDLDVYDIPVSQITAEYLEYLELMKELNLDVAGEFLVMAATLMQIKSRMLLPSPPAGEEPEGPDPRAELVAKLLEYQKYKGAARMLSVRETDNHGYFYRYAPVFIEEDFVLEANIFDLLAAFKDVLTHLPADVKEIVYEEIPVEEKIREIISLLGKAPADGHGRKFLNFRGIMEKERTRLGIIVLFIAMLELVRLKQIVARQSKIFGEIRVYLVQD